MQQGCQTCIRCARKNSSRYKLHSENERIPTVIGLKAEIFRNFRKTWRSLSKNSLAALWEPKFTCPSTYSAKSILLRQLFKFENLLDFNKKTQFYAFRAFFREIWFLCHLMAESRPNSELSVVKKLPFDSKIWKRNSIFIICWQKVYLKTSSRQLKVNARLIWASLWWLIGIKVEWRRGWQNWKFESHRHSRNTRKQLSFHSSSAAAGIMKLTNGNIFLLWGSTENPCCFRAKFWWL